MREDINYTKLMWKFVLKPFIKSYQNFRTFTFYQHIIFIMRTEQPPSSIYPPLPNFFELHENFASMRDILICEDLLSMQRFVFEWILSEFLERKQPIPEAWNALFGHVLRLFTIALAVRNYAYSLIFVSCFPMLAERDSNSVNKSFLTEVNLRVAMRRILGRVLELAPCLHVHLFNTKVHHFRACTLERFECTVGPPSVELFPVGWPMCGRFCCRNVLECVPSIWVRAVVAFVNALSKYRWKIRTKACISERCPTNEL